MSTQINRIRSAATLPLAALFTLLLACGGDAAATAGRDADDGSDGADAPAAAEAAEAAVGVGEVARAGELAVAVVGWDWYQPPPDGHQQPDAGHRYLLVDVIVANEGDRPVLANLSNARLTEDAGGSYTPDFLANYSETDPAVQDEPDGELAPGERTRGHYVFEVPESASGFQLLYRHGVGRDASGARALARQGGASEEDLEGAPTGAGGVPEARISLGDQHAAAEAPDLGTAAPGAAGTVAVDDWGVSVADVRWLDDVPEQHAPEPGFRYMIVDLSVENRAGATRAFEVPRRLKDAAGRQYSPSTSALLATGHNPASAMLARMRGQPDPDAIDAGATGTKTFGFALPEDAQGPFFMVFDLESAAADGQHFLALP